MPLKRDTVRATATELSSHRSTRDRASGAANYGVAEGDAVGEAAFDSDGEAAGPDFFERFFVEEEVLDPELDFFVVSPLELLDVDAFVVEVELPGVVL